MSNDFVRPPMYAPADPDGPVGTRLVTGEAVAMDIRIARLGSRMLARILDFFVEVGLGLGLGLIVAVFFSYSNDADPAIVQALGVIVVVTTLIGYPVLMETFARGRTLGKLAMGLRVVRDDGGPIRFRQALARTLVGFSAEFPGLLPPLTWFACIGTMLTNPQGKRLGDIAAGTIVIHERTPETWGWVPSMPPELAGWAATLDITGLGDGLALAVRNYLARNRRLREPARTRLGAQLAAEVSACVTPPPPPGTAGWAYLAAVLAERHRRSLARIARARAATAAVWPELSRLTAGHVLPQQPTGVQPWLPPAPPLASAESAVIRPAVPYAG